MRFTRAVLRGWDSTVATLCILNWGTEATGGIGTGEPQSVMKVGKKETLDRSLNSLTGLRTNPRHVKLLKMQVLSSSFMSTESETHLL